MGRVMLMLFWDSKEPLLEHYMSEGTLLTSSSYCDLLVNHLKPEVCSKCCGQLTTGILLLHDNARPHTAHETVAKIEDLHFQCPPHPPYSPDLTTSNFHVCGTKRGTVRNEVQVWWSSSRSATWLAVQDTKRVFFKRDSGFSKVLEQTYWKQQGLCWKILQV